MLRSSLGFSLLAVTLLVAACGAQPQQSGNASALLSQTAEAMSGVKTVSADFTFGKGVSLGSLTLLSATSKLDSSGDSSSTFKVRQGDFLVDVQLITLGGKSYLQLPFSKFTLLTAAQSKEIPNPARLLDPSTGLPALLTKGSQLSYLGQATLAGVPCDEVRATFSATQIGTAVLGPGSSVPGNATATFWSARSSHLLRKVQVSGDLLKAGQKVSLDAILSGYGTPVAISTPATP